MFSFLFLSFLLFSSFFSGTFWAYGRCKEFLWRSDLFVPIRQTDTWIWDPGADSSAAWGFRAPADGRRLRGSSDGEECGLWTESFALATGCGGDGASIRMNIIYRIYGQYILLFIITLLYILLFIIYYLLYYYIIARYIIYLDEYPVNGWGGGSTENETQKITNSNTLYDGAKTASIMTWSSCHS